MPSRNAVLEWFWRGRALAEQRAAVPFNREPAQSFVQRARVSADVAAIALVAEPIQAANEAVACELYRQSAYWSLCALSATPADLASPEESDAPWQLLGEPSFEVSASTLGKSPSELQRVASSGSFVAFANMASAEVRPYRLAFRELSRALILLVDRRSDGLRTVRAQRFWRLGLLAAIPLALLVVALLRHSDLASGKPWRTSTTYGLGGCVSPEQRCGSGYFFHTAVEDPSPWVEIDLGSVHSVSSVDVENRTDCCPERALPLAVEVSDDQRNWRTVARRDAAFAKWTADFARVQARYVRLHTLRPTAMHLSRVSVYR